jgi:NAD(P)-dependent dehydrogenase (short-subunit alcohol dehydrogenase family)
MPQTVLITGTSSGIGRETALQFAAHGWQVAATMRNPEHDTTLANTPGVSVYKLDVTDPSSVTEAVTEVIDEFGKIDVLVNNAGFGTDGVFEAMSDEDIIRQFDTNVVGLMRVTRALIPHMRAQGKGVIVQVSSMGGRITFPLYSIYHSTKWAVEGFSESLQYELEKLGIRVKLIEPGAINTEFYGRNRRFIMRDDLSMYKDIVAKAEKVIQEIGETGASPEVVARRIFTAATDKSKRLRYPVGNPAPMILFLRKVLPDWMFFALVKRVYKLH